MIRRLRSFLLTRLVGDDGCGGETLAVRQIRNINAINITLSTSVYRSYGLSKYDKRYVETKAIIEKARKPLVDQR